MTEKQLPQQDMLTQATNEVISTKSADFRGTVGSFVDASGLFETWSNPLGNGETMTVLDAIENNEVTLYLGNHSTQDQIDAVQYLVTIYDELKKDEPQMQFILETVDSLKEVLAKYPKEDL